MIHVGEFGEIRSDLSASTAMVVPQNTTQAGIARDIRRIGWAGSVREWDDSNGAVFCSLMRTDQVVERHVFPKQVFEVPFAEDDEMLQTFVADGLVEL